MRYTKLLEILWIKEKIHYKRLKKCLNNMDNWPARLIAWPLVCVIVTFFHYCFALMHFLFESFMFLYNRNQFKQNMINFKKELNLS